MKVIGHLTRTLLFLHVLAPFAASAEIVLHLTSPKPAVLLGEAVLLEMRLENRSSAELHAGRLTMGRHTGFKFDHGRAGGPLERLESNAIPELSADTRMEILSPGKSWCFQERLGYKYSRGRLPLLFPEPGKYEIVAIFPANVSSKGLPRPRIVVSDALVIEVKAPEGKDEEVWRTIRERSLMYAFCHSFGGGSERAAPLAEVAERGLRLHPSSGYSPELRRLLREFYDAFPTRWEALGENRREELKPLIGWKPPPHTLEPFPNDKRLEFIVAFEFPERTPFPKAFERFERQSGVPLRASNELAELWSQSLPQRKPLREVMRQYAGTGTRWFPDGEGYILRKVPEEPKVEPPYAPCPKAAAGGADGTAKPEGPAAAP